MIVLLPGITGSVLQKDGKDVWAISGQATWRVLSSLGSSLQQLRLEGDEVGDSVTATRIMPDAHLIPGLVKIDGYTAISTMIRHTFDVVPGSRQTSHPANFIEFPYDWRLDNRVNAQQLKALIDKQLHIWRQYSHNPTAGVIFVAHSMGGLVARYYLEVLEGWRTCRALITFGTPYRGSPSALNFLANGYKKLFVDLTEAMRSFPSVYQLLPIYKALRVGVDYLRVAEVENVPGIDPRLAKDALAFHREIEDKITEHRRGDQDYLEHGYVILPVVGTRQPTLQSAILADGRVNVSSEVPSWMDPILGDGDGTVPRASAIPIELSNAFRNSFAPERHGSLQCNQSILNDLQGRLEQMQVQGLAEIRGPIESLAAAETPAIALELDDLYLSGEPILLRAQLVNSAESLGPVRAHIASIDGPEVAALQSLDFARVNGGWVLVVEGAPPGLYRIEVRTAKGGPKAPPPVHDIFEVAA
jgi:pimeloyl-ACP methyl ester carboxylesterase